MCIRDSSGVGIQVVEHFPFAFTHFVRSLCNLGRRAFQTDVGIIRILQIRTAPGRNFCLACIEDAARRHITGLVEFGKRRNQAGHFGFNHVVAAVSYTHLSADHRFYPKTLVPCIIRTINRKRGNVMRLPTIEILAPVGGPEQLRAAVRCGAHAVYLGVQGFNARRNAENFDAVSLRQAVRDCHARDVRIYATLNTLINDAEIPAFVEQARLLADCGIDAVIVQDLGAASLLHVLCPSLPLHASTQMTIHNPVSYTHLDVYKRQYLYIGN